MILSWEQVQEEEVDLLAVLWISGGNHHSDRFRCWKTHPSLSEIPSRYFTIPYQEYSNPVQSVRIAASEGVGVWEIVLCSWSSSHQIQPDPSTQLRGTQGTSFELSFVWLWRRNSPGCTNFSFRAQLPKKHIQGSREFIGLEPEKPFWPTTKHSRVVSFSHTSPDSDDGITGTHQLSRRRVQTLRGSPPESSLICSGTIFSLIVTRRSYEGRMHLLR